METVRYRGLLLDEVLEQQDQFLAEGEPEWQLIQPDTIGFTPRRYAALGTKWRRPYFQSDPIFGELLSADEYQIGDMRARQRSMVNANC